MDDERKHEVGHWITVDELEQIHRNGREAYKKGELKMQPSTSTDPYGISELFRERLNENLELLSPEPAAKEAMQTVLDYLKASKFVDVGTKSTTGRHYIRVDRPPDETTREKEGLDAG